MSYIASKRFTNTPQGTENETKYEPGDPVPDFDLWPEHARTVLLRQNYVTPNFAALPADDAEYTAEDAAVGDAVLSKVKRAVRPKK